MKAWALRRPKCSPRFLMGSHAIRLKVFGSSGAREEVGFKKAVQERDSGDPIAPGVSADFFKF